MHKLPSTHGHPRGKPLRLRALVPWLIAVWVVTGFHSVRTNEHGLVRRCGRALAELRGPGLHLGLPLGIDSVTRIKLRERKRVPVGRGLAERALGRPSLPLLEERLTGDRNLILASAIVQYEIADAEEYLFGVSDVPTLVSNITASALSAAISKMKVDDVLTIDRLAIQEKVRLDAQEALSQYGAGVRLTAVQFEELAAPREVADAFRDVTRAREDRARAVNEADGYAKRLLPRTNGEAVRARLEAEARAEELVQQATGRAASFSLLHERIAGDRDLAYRRLTLETMERVLPRLRKIILDGTATDALDLDLLEGNE